MRRIQCLRSEGGGRVAGPRNALNARNWGERLWRVRCGSESILSGEECDDVLHFGRLLELEHLPFCVVTPET